jgi:putative transport protein
VVRGGVRVFELTNQQWIGHPVHEVFERLDTPVLRLERQGATVPLIDNPRLKAGDLLTVAGKLKNLIGEYVSLGPEVANEDARHLDLEQAEIVLAQPAFAGKTLEEFHESPPAYGVRVRALFRAGHELSLLPAIKLQKGDVLRVLGPKICVGRAVKALGRAVYPTDATSIITLSLGAAFGYMVGLISVSIGGVPIGLGTPAGVILAGIAVATLRTLNPSWGGPVPEATRDFLETIGLDLFVGGLGLNVAPSLVKTLSQGRSVVLVLVIGLLAALIPPFISWLVGLYVFKMDPIFLAGAVAGSRSSTTAMKALQDETKSTIPALGYPVPYALAAVVVLIYAYLAMLFS